MVANMDAGQKAEVADRMRDFMGNLKWVPGKGGGGVRALGGAAFSAHDAACGSGALLLRSRCRSPLPVRCRCRAFLEAKGGGSVITKDMVDEFAAQMRTASRCRRP